MSSKDHYLKTKRKWPIKWRKVQTTQIKLLCNEQMLLKNGKKNWKNENILFPPKDRTIRIFRFRKLCNRIWSCNRLRENRKYNDFYTKICIISFLNFNFSFACFWYIFSDSNVFRQKFSFQWNEKKQKASLHVKLQVNTIWAFYLTYSSIWMRFQSPK